MKASNVGIKKVLLRFLLIRGWLIHRSSPMSRSGPERRHVCKEHSFRLLALHRMCICHVTNLVVERVARAYNLALAQRVALSVARLEVLLVS